MNLPITISDKAVEMAKEYLNDEEGRILRVGIKGAGCAGFSWVLEPTKEFKEKDFRFEVNGLNIAIDPVSAQYLKGTEIGFKTGFKTGFTFNSHNPKARSCGCGESFSIDE